MTVTDQQVDQVDNQDEQEARDQLKQELIEAQDKQERKSRRRSIIVIVVVAVVVIILLLLLLLLRGCTGHKTQVSTGPTGPITSDPILANRVHTAIHPTQLGNGKLADIYVYIIDVARQQNNTVATIRLNVLNSELVQQISTLGAAKMEKDFESATLTKLPEIKSVRIADSSGAVLSSETRK